MKKQTFTIKKVYATIKEEPRIKSRLFIAGENVVLAR